MHSEILTETITEYEQVVNWRVTRLLRIFPDMPELEALALAERAEAGSDLAHEAEKLAGCSWQLAVAILT